MKIKFWGTAACNCPKSGDRVFKIVLDKGYTLASPSTSLITHKFVSCRGVYPLFYFLFWKLVILYRL